jgi:hypothetical protein
VIDLSSRRIQPPPPCTLPPRSVNDLRWESNLLRGIAQPPSLDQRRERFIMFSGDERRARRINYIRSTDPVNQDYFQYLNDLKNYDFKLYFNEL